MSEKVVIPAELREKLAGANGRPVALHDDAGNVVGYCLSAAALSEIESDRLARSQLWTDEDIARLERERANDPRPDVPHEGVMRWFKENIFATEEELDAAERSGGSHTMDDVFKLLAK